VRFEMSRVPKDRLDFELGLAALGLVLVLGVVVLRILPEKYHPRRPCTFHVVTGIPCLTCGGTRAALALGRLEFGEALALNPLVAGLLILALPYAIWILVARVFDLPRPRVRSESRRDKWILRASILLAVAGNWGYLIAAGV
jgi:hypothetical protein